MDLISLTQKTTHTTLKLTSSSQHTAACHSQMSKRLDSSAKPAHILPLTQEDILGRDNASVPLAQQDDLASIATSLQSSSNSLAAFAKRQQNRLKIKSISQKQKSLGFFKTPKYFKTFLNFKSLDFETAVWDMANLVMQPKRVYKSLYYQKQTKNKWSRDDPSFVLILSLLLTISAICWGLTYSKNPIIIFKLILYMVIVDFLLVGIVVASIGWILANNFFLQSTGVISTSSSSSHYYSNKYLKYLLPADTMLEWAYCFDIHCNSYLFIWIALYFLQFFFLPLLRLNNWFSTLLGNTLYFSSLCYYCIITFYGYNALPFLKKTELLLAPIPVFVIFWLILTLSGFNVANYMSNAYFN